MFPFCRFKNKFFMNNLYRISTDLKKWKHSLKNFQSHNLTELNITNVIKKTFTITINTCYMNKTVFLLSIIIETGLVGKVKVFNV
jgi:hypothetical protein